MTTQEVKRKASYVYLIAVPFVSALFGFGVGHVSYKIYVPVWLLNVAIMILAAENLRAKHSSNRSGHNHVHTGGFLLIVPWMIVSMFSGLGPPPETASGWVETATEQQVRYLMLVAAGVFAALGFSIIRYAVKQLGENVYSLLGLTFIVIAMPLFIINMIYWGFYLPELFRIHTVDVLEKLPEWFMPVRKLFGIVSVVEVALTYLATASFAISLLLARVFTSVSGWIYVSISLVAMVLIILSAFLPEPFITAGFAVSIPATPLIMPYFMGINLLRKKVG
jgi:hypothetical protein